MNEERDSITALVFHALGGLAGVVTVICMMTKTMAVGPGLASLMSSLVLWWMGDVVALLKGISFDLRQRSTTHASAAVPASNAKPASQPAAKRSDAAVYKLD